MTDTFNGLGLTPEKTKIDKEKLSNLLYNNLKDITIEELINQKIAKIGEKIEVKKFVRFQI